MMAFHFRPTNLAKISTEFDNFRVRVCRVLATRELGTSRAPPDGLEVVEAVDSDLEVQDKQAGIGQLFELSRQRDKSLK